MDSSTTISATAFGLTAVLITLYQSRTRQSKKRKAEPRSSVVRYLSGISGAWSEYTDDTESFVRDFPKIELHVHLDGAFDPDYLWNYLQGHPEMLQQCLPVQTTPPWEDKPLYIRQMVENCESSRDFHSLCTCRGYRSLTAMLNCFEVFLPLVRGNLHLIEQLSFDFCQRQFEQNVVYTEVRYSPNLLAEAIANGHSQTKETVSPQDVYLAVTRGLRKGCETFEITVNQILCAITWRPDWAPSVLEIAQEYFHDFPCGVIGVDVAAGEEHFDKKKHPNLFQAHYDFAQKAKALKIPLTIHAGEVSDEGMNNVRRAVVEYHAKRIGHGYRMVESEEIMRLVQSRGVHVEICPTSSVETGGWNYNGLRDWFQHPANTMKEHNIRLSLSSDDPAVFHTSLAWQYRVALAKLKWINEDLIQSNLDAIDAAFCTKNEKVLLKEIIRSYAKAYTEMFDSSHEPNESRPPFSDRVYLDK